MPEATLPEKSPYISVSDTQLNCQNIERNHHDLEWNHDGGDDEGENPVTPGNDCLATVGKQQRRTADSK